MPPGSRALLAEGLLSPAVVLGQAFLDCFAWVRMQAAAAELDAMSVVDETVENGVGVGRIADDFVPAIYWKLRGDHRGAAAIALFEDFQEIMTRGGVEWLQPPIIEDQKVGAAERAQEARMTAVAARQREVFEQTGRPLVDDRPIVATGFVAKR